MHLPPCDRTFILANKTRKTTLTNMVLGPQFYVCMRTNLKLVECKRKGKIFMKEKYKTYFSVIMCDQLNYKLTTNTYVQ